MIEPEPGAGSNFSMLQPSAERRGHNWIVDRCRWFIRIGAVAASASIAFGAARESIARVIGFDERPAAMQQMFLSKAAAAP